MKLDTLFPVNNYIDLVDSDHLARRLRVNCATALYRDKCYWKQCKLLVNLQYFSLVLEYPYYKYCYSNYRIQCEFEYVRLWQDIAYVVMNIKCCTTVY